MKETNKIDSKSMVVNSKRRERERTKKQTIAAARKKKPSIVEYRKKSVEFDALER
jgi:hypothetical protein